MVSRGRGRGGLSPLRGQKWCHNYIDIRSGVSRCNQGIEDTSHFLFLCPFYADQRVALRISVNMILYKLGLNHLVNQSQLYLYGDSPINNSDNREILLSTIKYMKETQRFSTITTTTTPPLQTTSFNYCRFLCFLYLYVWFVLNFYFY